MTDQRPVRIIPKEKAVFHLDANGRWQNEHGPFEHPKIIAFFHASIRKDDDGYYLYQETDEYIEKVYFPFEDTALFVFQVLKINGEPATLVFNTGLEIPLEPQHLFLANDQLYYRFENERARFTERSLLKLANHLQPVEDGFYIQLKDHKYPIQEVEI